MGLQLAPVGLDKVSWEGWWAVPHRGPRKGQTALLQSEAAKPVVSSPYAVTAALRRPSHDCTRDRLRENCPPGLDGEEEGYERT